MSYVGRGAWSAVGGTLTRLSGSKVTIPGKYYMRPSKGVLAPGVAADEVLLVGGVPDLNEYAVWYGVLALKTRLHEIIGLVNARDLVMNGRYGSGVRDAVAEYQGVLGLVADGIVGPVTAKAFFEPVVHELGADSAIGARIGCGLVTNESAYDMGAVGMVDSDDHGLCQLNAPSQHFTLDQSFNVRIAVERLYLILDANLALFGNERDAIAAYNLGKTGCKLWISEGRPDEFIPLSQRDDPDAVPRKIKAYIDRILVACTL